MKAICLPPRNWSSFWAFCASRLTFFLKWEFWMVLFKAEAVFASDISKFGKFFPETDREDFNSSNESSISTSLIHNIASDGKSEQVIESRREQLRLQEELSMKEKVLGDTQIRNIHELGEMKKAQSLRVDDFSVQKWRESHETVQRLTSQLQEMQEQMNYPLNRPSPLLWSIKKAEGNQNK